MSGRVSLHACDLADRAAVETLLRQVRPDQVYHLAGYASTSQSYRDPDAAWAGNLDAARNLFEAIIPPRSVFLCGAETDSNPKPTASQRPQTIPSPPRSPVQEQPFDNCP